MKPRFKIFSLTSVIALTSCAANRTVYDFSQAYLPATATAEVVNQVTFSESTFDEVWETVIQFFAARNLPIETIEKDSGLVVARRQVGVTIDHPELVSPGYIETTTQPYRERLVGDGSGGYLDVSHIRANGRVTKRTPTGDPTKSEQPARYDFAITFNVFVQRFQTQSVIATINVVYEPRSKLLLHTGSSPNPPTEDAEFLNRLGQMANESKEASTIPVSTGIYERQFIEFMLSKLK